MKVALGTFACFCIEARFGPDPTAAVQAALRHYTRRLKSAKAPLPLPTFFRSPGSDGLGAEFDLAVDPEVEAALEDEARVQKVPVEQLVPHAVFVYLADLDSADAVDWTQVPGRLV
ncbi:MAG: hypothetical protein WB507_09485 [Solirubrobacterales bacterium]